MATGGGSTGRALFGAAISGGAAALGVGPAGLVAGAVADIVSLRADHPALLGRDGDALLDSWIFAGSSDVVDCVWARGAKRVADGRHHRRDAVRARFRAAMERLVA